MHSFAIIESKCFGATKINSSYLISVALSGVPAKGLYRAQGTWRFSAVSPSSAKNVRNFLP